MLLMTTAMVRTATENRERTGKTKYAGRLCRTILIPGARQGGGHSARRTAVGEEAVYQFRIIWL